MVRRLALTLVPIALLAAACAGGKDASDDGAQLESTPQPPAAAGDVDIGEGTGEIGDTVLGALNPLQFLGGLGGQPASLTSQEIDPYLKAALLTADDLPAEFTSMGEFTFSVPGDFGGMEMAASQFVSGDLTGDDFDAMVMSAVMSLPPEALEELNELGDLSETDLAQIESASGQFGAEFADLRVLDASGLGDGGFGMHLELNFGALFAAFGPPAGEAPPPAGIAMDMYAFFRSERVLMAMVMWPVDSSPGVDGRDLAETMDAKAAAAS